MTAEKGEPCVTTVKCHPELNPRDLEVSSTSTALHTLFRLEMVANVKQHRKVVIEPADTSLSGILVQPKDSLRGFPGLNV